MTGLTSNTSPELESSLRDVQRTGKILTTAQWAVASVVMVGSALSAGLAFEYFGEPFGVGVITGIAIDFALASWLLISRRLRSAGVTTVWGPILEGITALMTLCLNSGTSILKENYWLATFHAFLPIVLFALSMAGGESQQKLHRIAKQKEAEEKRRRDAETAQIKSDQATDQARIDGLKQSEHAARQAEAGERIRTAELLNEQHKREMDDRAAERGLRERDIASRLASVMHLGTAWRALALSNLEERRHRPASTPRQAATPGSPGRSTSPVGVGRRLASRVAPRSKSTTKPQDAPDLARLAEVAKHLLAENPGMGRATLANELGVSSHYARLVLDLLKQEREEQKDAELMELLGKRGAA